jgi:glycosyltransferase involved in cell wall biosynthesis
MAYYKHLNLNCSFLPNYIDIKDRYSFDSKFDWKTYASKQGCKVDENSLLIGFFGSSSHITDLNEIIEPIIQILREYDNVFFGILCEFDMAMNVCMRNHKVPANKLVFFDCQPFTDYPHKISSFDIGLAPVVNTIFGRCKSALKLYEYGALSIPYVASKVANNQRFHVESNGIGGFISNDSEDWYNNIKKLIDNKELRQSMGEKLKDYIIDNHDVNHSLRPLVDTFDTIYSNKLRKFNHPSPYDLADCHDGIPEVKTSYKDNDFCPCGSGDLYINCNNDCYPAWGTVLHSV